MDDFLGHDLLAVFQDYLTEREEDASEDEDRQELLRCAQFDTDGRTISGIIEAGDYGYETEIYSVTDRALAYRRRSTDAELLPFYFLLSVPEGATRAILIVERFRQLGIRSVLWNDLLGHMDAYRQDVVIQLEPIVPAGVIDAIRNSEDIKSIRFIRFSLPSDITDDLDPHHELEEDDGVLELVVKANPGAHLPAVDRFLQWLRGNQPLGEMIQIQGVDFEQVKVQVEVSGKTRTVEIGDFGRVRGHIDVTEEVDVDRTGHPTFDSIDTAAREHLEDIHHQLDL